MPLRFDATGYSVRYPDATIRSKRGSDCADVDRQIGSWLLVVGPTLGRSTLDGDGFEEAWRGFAVATQPRRGLRFDARACTTTRTAATRFAYLVGSRRASFARAASGSARTRRLRPRAQRSGGPRRRPCGSDCHSLPTATVRHLDGSRGAHRTSRYGEASVPRKERLLELSFVARRGLPNWTLSVEYHWLDNDSTEEDFSYDGQRFVLGLSRSFYGR